MSLAGKTLFMSGGSRGIGLAIAKAAAAEGANVAIAAKTAEPHPRLRGTVFTAADEINDAGGGRALAHVCDIRSEEQVDAAIAATVAAFGGIDICINNASAISLGDTASTPMKRYDLMQEVNTRGTFMVSKKALPHLQAAAAPHILNLSPPLDLDPKWFKNHVAYSIAKYGMSLCVLGMAAEFREQGIGVNALWPLTAIDTAAVRNVIGDDEMAMMCRKTSIVADAAVAILKRDPRECTGNFFIDEEVLRAEGVTDFSLYQEDGVTELLADLFIPDDVLERSPGRIVQGLA
ncbi:MAG: NAD(P)-dependent oxidoreductase [Granulosicoccus sp.]|nr:NAD(P)-dependent oxidoreductase [Granulosicoccus sp.]